jgi:hypothetical protein
MMRVSWVWLSLVSTLLAVAPARCADRYYVMVFSAQRPVNLPHYSHTFATFVRVRDGSPRPALEAFTLSWLPRSLDVEAWRLLPEPGRNLDLHSTLSLAIRWGDRISLWGPYQIRPELYARALRQKNRLESGAVSYKAVNPAFDGDAVCNCVDAIIAVSGEEPPPRVMRQGWGDVASCYVVRHLVPWIVPSGANNDWLLAELGISLYPLYRRN